MDVLDSQEAAGKPYGDLFGSLPQGYPHSPGSKARGTSADAARSIAKGAGKVRSDTLKEYLAAGRRGLTPDEAAKLVGLSVLYIRPRCTELKALGLIERTPERRPNDSGLPATVLRATSKAYEAAS